MMDSGAVEANSTSLVLVTVATALVGAWVWLQQKPRKDFLPGPKGWPLLGNILDFRGKPTPELFSDYAKEYGDIFAIRIGQTWTVVLNGVAVIKEALLKKGVEFAGRAVTYNGDLLSEGGKNIVFGQFSPTWKLHRKLAYSAFRKLATGNNQRFEKVVYAVLPGLTEHLDSKGTEPFDPRSTLASAIYNLLTTMCFGKQYDFDSPHVKELIHLNHRGTELVANGIPADYFPIFKYIPTPAQREVEALFARFCEIIEDEMKEHRDKFDPANEPADLTDLLLHARQEIIDEGKEDISLITDTHIRQTVADIFGEHFLDESGRVRLHPEGFLPFSTGRRVCLGESVAKAELFLLFAWLFQHYEFSKAPGTEQQDYSEGVDGAIVHAPKDITVVVKRRF